LKDFFLDIEAVRRDVLLAYGDFTKSFSIIVFDNSSSLISGSNLKLLIIIIYSSSSSMNLSKSSGSSRPVKLICLSDIFFPIEKADIFLNADLKVFVAENGLKDFFVIPS
jgi:hypothetical protein